MTMGLSLVVKKGVEHGNVDQNRQQIPNSNVFAAKPFSFPPSLLVEYISCLHLLFKLLWPYRREMHTTTINN